MVFVVLTMGQQSGRKGFAQFDRSALQSGGEIQPDEGRKIVRTQRSEQGHQRVPFCIGLGKEADGPGTDVFVGVEELFFEPGLLIAAHSVKGEQEAELVSDIRLEIVETENL